MLSANKEAFSLGLRHPKVARAIGAARKWWEPYGPAYPHDKIACLAHACQHFYDCHKLAIESRNEAIAQRDHWIRTFNRLDATISHHQKDKSELFLDEVDEALYAARAKVLRDLAGPASNEAGGAGDGPDQEHATSPRTGSTTPASSPTRSLPQEPR